MELIVKTTSPAGIVHYYDTASGRVDVAVDGTVTFTTYTGVTGVPPGSTIELGQLARNGSFNTFDI